MIKDLTRQISIELFKTRRARLGRIALFSAFIGGALPIILIGIIGDRGASTFPGVVPQVLLPSLTVLTGLVSMLLSLSSWGDEYEHGTLRLMLSRSPERWRALLAKTAASALALLAIIVVALAAELLVGVLSHVIQSDVTSLLEQLLSLAPLLPPIVGVWWLAGMVYSSAVTLVITGGRSPTLGMIGGLGLYLGDLLVSNLGLNSAGWIGDYSIINNAFGLIASHLGDLYRQSGGALFSGIAGMAPVDPGQIVGRLLLYSAGTLFLAYLVFRQQDIHP
jgi:ABC-type transport system involved in multi-copper enzyme maturation permease subunit